MISHFQIAARYISYYLNSKTLNSIHSPSIYELISTTLEDKRNYYAYRELEALRRHLYTRDEYVEIVDLGAGSRITKHNKRKISDIAKTALSPAQKAQFLFKLTKHLQPQHILEFGTSLGLSALYMHKACSSAQLTTIEGDPSIANLAQQYFTAERASINLINASFDDALVNTDILKSNYELIYIDGNHTEKSTAKYVKELYNNIADGGVIILDDIYWSAGMMNVWKSLATDPRFAFSVDLFDYGILIKDYNHKQHESFTVIKRSKKPFSLGIWG